MNLTKLLNTLFSEATDLTLTGKTLRFELRRDGKRILVEVMKIFTLHKEGTFKTPCYVKIVKDVENFTVETLLELVEEVEALKEEVFEYSNKVHKLIRNVFPNIKCMGKYYIEDVRGSKRRFSTIGFEREIPKLKTLKGKVHVRIDLNEEKVSSARFELFISYRGLRKIQLEVMDAESLEEVREVMEKIVSLEFFKENKDHWKTFVEHIIPFPFRDSISKKELLGSLLFLSYGMNDKNQINDIITYIIGESVSLGLNPEETLLLMNKPLTLARRLWSKKVLTIKNGQIYLLNRSLEDVISQLWPTWRDFEKDYIYRFIYFTSPKKQSEKEKILA